MTNDASNLLVNLATEGVPHSVAAAAVNQVVFTNKLKLDVQQLQQEDARRSAAGGRQLTLHETLQAQQVRMSTFIGIQSTSII